MVLNNQKTREKNQKVSTKTQNHKICVKFETPKSSPVLFQTVSQRLFRTWPPAPSLRAARSSGAGTAATPGENGFDQQENRWRINTC